jgi:WD40 repeat protein
MAQAQGAWESRDFVWLRELLAAQVPQDGEVDLRRFEWHYWARKARSRAVILEVRKGTMQPATLSGDGSRAVTQALLGPLKFWDVKTAKVIRLQNAGVNTHVRAMSPDGSLYVTFGVEGKRPTVCETKTGKTRFTLPNADYTAAVTFSPDGSSVALGDSSLWTILDAKTGARRRSAGATTAKLATALTFNADGSRLAAVYRPLIGGEVLTIWESKTGIKRLAVEEPRGSEISAMAFSPDGKSIATLHMGLGIVKVRDATTGKVQREMKGRGVHPSDLDVQEVYASPEVAYSPDGSRIFSNNADGLHVWDANTGLKLSTVVGLRVLGLVVTRAGVRVVSAGDFLEVWDLHPDDGLRTLETEAPAVGAVAFSPDGSRLVTGGPNHVLKLWDARTTEVARTLKGHAADVTAIAYSPDGSCIASASADKTVKLWDPKTGGLIHSLEGHPERVRSAAFSKDGKHVVSASQDGTLKVWDVKTGKEIGTLAGRPACTSAAPNPDGARVASASEDGTVEVLDATTGKKLLTLEGHSDAVNAVAYSPDGSRLVSASSDRTLRVWDAGTGKVLFTLRGHISPVRCVAFSPDGSRIVSGSSDHTLKLWNAETGQNLLTLKGHDKPVRCVAFGHDGWLIASGDEDGLVRIWDGTPLAE